MSLPRNDGQSHRVGAGDIEGDQIARPGIAAAGAARPLRRIAEVAADRAGPVDIAICRSVPVRQRQSESGGSSTAAASRPGNRLARNATADHNHALPSQNGTDVDRAKSRTNEQDLRENDSNVKEFSRNFPASRVFVLPREPCAAQGDLCGRTKIRVKDLVALLVEVQAVLTATGGTRFAVDAGIASNVSM